MKTATPAPVTIGSRALEVLGVLIERHGDLVSRDEFLAAVWPNTVVEEANLAVQISALRRVVDQDRTDGSCIQTVPGRGYRFVAAVTRLAAGAPGPKVPAIEVPTDDPRMSSRRQRLRGAATFAPLSPFCF